MNGDFMLEIVDVAWFSNASNPSVEKEIIESKPYEFNAHMVGMGKGSAEGQLLIKENIPFGKSSTQPSIAEWFWAVEAFQLKIKNLSAQNGEDPFSDNFSISSLGATTKFQAIAFRKDGTEIGPIPVKWELDGGKADSPIRKEIVRLLGVHNDQRIGAFAVPAGLATTVDSAQDVEFLSMLSSSCSGPIWIKASFNNAITDVIALHLQQPVFKVAVWQVGDEPVALFDQWELATKQVWEKEGILQVASMELGKIENVVAPEKPLFPFPLPILTAESFLQSSYGELVSFMNPIVFDELLNSNFGTKSLVPRQPFALFSQKRFDDAVNIYVVNVVRTYKMIVGFVPEGGFAIDSDLPFVNFDDQQIILDKLRSGIAVRNFQTSTPQIIRYFPHEIGHILIRYKDEHKIDGLSVDVPADNIMGGNPGVEGLEVEAMQFIKILNLDKSKPAPSVFIMEN